MIRHTWLLLLLLTTGHSLYAQFELSGEIRPRTEYTHGFRSLSAVDQEPGFFTTQRSRLNAAYKSEFFETYVCLQDIRTWGSQRQLVIGDGALTSFHEAWGNARLNDLWQLKLGRQEIDLDDQRIFGSVNWAQQARSHDAALLKYKNDSNQVEFQLGLAYNQVAPQLNSTRYVLAGSYKTFQYAWLHKDWQHLGVSLLFLNLGQDAAKVGSHKTLFNQTAGIRLSYKKEKVSANAAFYQQLGLLGDTLETKLSAQLVSVDFSYKASKKVTIAGGYEYISGQNQVGQSAEYYKTQHAFNPYFGTNHKFNGVMDYFYVGNHIGSVGLQDPWVRFRYTYPSKWYFQSDVHYFMSATDVLDQKAFAIDGTQKAMDGALGTEVDLGFGGYLNPAVKIDFVYAHMFGTETMVALKGGSTTATSNWAYVMFTFKPTFFKN